MRYASIPPEVFIDNRRRFTAMLKPQSVAIFNSNDILPTNADGSMAFRQNNDLFYLSGIDQEESILCIFPDCVDEKHREILFLKETSETIAIWEGEKHSKKSAYEASGIRTVYWLQDFHRILKALVCESENVYLNSNEHLRASIETETRDMRFVKWMKDNYPLHNYQRSAPVMHQLRSVKSNMELELLQTAIDITEKGLRRILKFIKPDVWEHEIEAEFAHEFLRNRSRGFAYTPIIASGYSACVLHYIENNKQCKAGDVILLDVGAEYANYNADMTRCLPVSGKFTPRQKDVYNAVHRVMEAAKKMLRPGTMMADYHREVGKLMTEELITLKLITREDVKKENADWPAYKKYFMHGTSHFLGLDVHDVGLWHKPIQPGMVFTVEPGIYIREENLGIRLENNVMVTMGEPLDMFKNIPVQAEEIEQLMNEA
nr:aminopeptidase P N-terminal domain-containing protein [Bacteroidota bacterium]